MERKKLVNDVMVFCLEYRIFNLSGGINEIKQRIEEQFEDVVFVEMLINMIIVKSKSRNDIDVNRLINLLSDLERLRLDLEYKIPAGTSSKC